MKLLYITTRIDGVGGLQRTTSVKLNYLAEKGYDITVFTANTKSTSIHYPLSSKIKHIDVQNISSFFNYKKVIRKIFNQTKPDITIVSDNGLKGFLIPYFLPKKSKIMYEVHATKATIISETGNKIMRRLGISDFFINRSIKKFDVVIFLTPTEKENWNTKKAEIIPNPLWFSSDKTSTLETKKVIFSGRMNLMKGIDLLLEIWKNVSEKHPDWTLEIYGEKTPEFDVEKQIKYLKLSNTVKVFGHSADIHKKYPDASILVATSRFESFGLSIIEAMECGVPCISFDTEGAKNNISNQINGILVESCNTQLFSEKVIELIENNNLRKQMGQNAKDAVQKFKTEIVMKQWISLFDRADIT